MMKLKRACSSVEYQSTSGRLRHGHRTLGRDDVGCTVAKISTKFPSMLSKDLVHVEEV